MNMDSKFLFPTKSISGDYSIITYLHIFYINWLQTQMFLFYFTQVYMYKEQTFLH